MPVREIRAGLRHRYTPGSVKGLYAIVDLDFLAERSVDAISFAEAVLEAKPAALQLRAKRATPRDTLAVLRDLQPRCRAAGVPLFANDRPDLAVMADCEGIHVGQDDLSVEDVRKFSPRLMIGISTHDEAQLREAVALQPTYVAFGPVFLTLSKEEPDPVVGMDRLRRLAPIAADAGIPTVAIGGITLDRARLVAEAAPMAAVISSLLPPEGLADVSRRARELHWALGGPK